MREAGMDAARLRQFVTELPRTERQVLMLYYAESLTPPEIGAVLRISPESVRDMLLKIRARTKALLRSDAASIVPA